MTAPTDPTCEAITRHASGNPDEAIYDAVPCGKRARWRLRAATTGVGINICQRHATWWRKQTGLRSLVDGVLEPLREPSEVR